MQCPKQWMSKNCACPLWWSCLFIFVTNAWCFLTVNEEDSQMMISHMLKIISITLILLKWSERKKKVNLITEITKSIHVSVMHLVSHRLCHFYVLFFKGINESFWHQMNGKFCKKYHIHLQNEEHKKRNQAKKKCKEMTKLMQNKCYALILLMDEITLYQITYRLFYCSSHWFIMVNSQVIRFLCQYVT